MALRLISAANGFVQDVEQLSVLSDDACNLRALSDRTLYILQNLSGLDITFLSRYGTIESNDEYLPVSPGSPEAATVETAIDIVRRDLTDMSCNDIVIAINALTSVVGTNACGCPVGQGEDTTAGVEGGPVPPPIGDIVFEEPAAVPDRKCKAANAIHLTVTEVFTKLEDYGVDQMGVLGLALAVTVITGIIASTVTTPIGGIVVGIAGGLAILGAKLIGISVFNLGDILAALAAGETDLVCELYNATTADGGRDAYIAELSSLGLTGVETALVGLILSNGVMNILFFDTPETAVFWDTFTPAVDCSTCDPPLGTWIISPSGFKGINSVGGVPLGTGVIDQGGGTFTISSVPRDVGGNIVSLQIFGWNKVVNVITNEGSDITLVGCVPLSSSPTNLRSRAGGPCGNPINQNVACTEPGDMPETLTDGTLAFWYNLNDPFDFTISIDSLSVECP